VADIVAKMPAHDAAAGQPMLDEILKLGEPGLKELCSLVTPPDQTNDAGARYAVHGLVLYTKRPGAEAERAMVEKALIDALAAAQDPDLKVFFIEQIQLCGSDACISAVAPLMDSERLCDPATKCLTRIGTPKCVEAIRAELPKAKGICLVTTIQALGVVRDAPSAKALLPYAKSEDRDLRRTAWYALANIGDAAAVETLAGAAAAEGKYERALGTKYYLLLASRLAENGDKDTAAKICRELLKTRTDPADGNVQCAALYVLQKALGDGAADELLAAMDGKNAYVKAAAVALLDRTGGKELTGKLIERAKGAAGQTRADLIALLGRRADESAAAIVIAAMDDKDPAVAAAAIQAAAKLGSGNVLGLMCDRLKSADAAVVAAAKGVLTGIQADGLEQALTAAFAGASPAGKAAVLDLLAARGSKGSSKVAFDALAETDPAVHAAAVRALAALAGPADLDRLMTLMLSPDDQGLASAAQGIVVTLCRKGPGAKPLLDALAKAQPKQAAVLLDSLSRLGGADALAAVMKQAESSDAETKDTAVRAMTNWQGGEAMEPLAALAARTDNNVHRVLAIRGIVRLAGREADAHPAEAVAALSKALAAAQQPAEKNQVIGALGGIRTIESLKLVTGQLDDDATRESAAAAAVKIACPDRRYKGQAGPAAVEAMKKVVAVSKTNAVVQQAKKRLESIDKGK